MNSYRFVYPFLIFRWGILTCQNHERFFQELDDAVLNRLGGIFKFGISFLTKGKFVLKSLYIGKGALQIKNSFERQHSVNPKLSTINFQYFSSTFVFICCVRKSNANCLHKKVFIHIKMTFPNFSIRFIFI